MNNDTDRHCNDLTQLCSREQLSALMDGALPEDQTRFLLRRLQHDAALAGCWERWRIAADTMRGTTPSRRLPADFASRVAAALQEDAPLDAAARASARTAQRRRLGGGAALAAALAAMAILGLPVGETTAPTHAPALTTQMGAHASGQATRIAHTGTPAPRAPTNSNPAPAAALPEAFASLAAVTATRVNRRKSQREAVTTSNLTPASANATAPVEFAVSAPTTGEVTARPWPRSILPQYGNANLTVGFGVLPAQAQDAATYRASPAFATPPKFLKAQAPESADNTAAADDSASPHKGKLVDDGDAQP